MKPIMCTKQTAALGHVTTHLLEPDHGHHHLRHLASFSARTRIPNVKTPRSHSERQEKQETSTGLSYGTMKRFEHNR